MQVTVITKRGQPLTEYLTLFGIAQSTYPNEITGTSDLLKTILNKNVVYYPLNYSDLDFTRILSNFVAYYPLSFDPSESQTNIISVFLYDYPLESSESGLERLSFRTPVIYPIELPGSPPVSGNSFVGIDINQIPFYVETIFPLSFNGIAINSIPFSIIMLESNVFYGNSINGIPFEVNIGNTPVSFISTAINTIPFEVNIGNTPVSFISTAINTIPFSVSISDTPHTFSSLGINQIPFTAIDWPRTASFSYNYNVLQIIGTGTNNATNNTFVDSSSNNITITKFDNATQGSFSPYSTAAGAWSVYFDGNGDTLTAPANSAFSFGTGNFTIECWVYLTAYPSNYAAVATNRVYNGTNSGTWWFNVGTGGGCWFGQAISSGAQFVGANVAIPLNTWTHIAVVRASTDANGVSMYFNGVLVGQSTINANFNVSSNILRIGEAGDGISGWFSGYISNLRIVKGTAIYTSAFTPSASPLTAVSGTSLLTCQSNRFIDNSSNAFAITINGNTMVEAFSPFFPASSYTPSTQGGSVYLSGIDDFLYNLDNNSAIVLNGNFTIECWIYFLAGSSNESQAIYTNYFDPYAEGAVFFGKSVEIGGLVSFWTGNFSLTSPLIADTTLPPNNAWTHYAVVKNGTNITLYRNGSSVATTTWGGIVNSTPGPIFIGTYGSAAGDFILRGYTSDFRIVRSAVYTSNFTPPSSPLTTIPNTGLLIGGRNSAIYDSTFNTVIETAGEAKVSTAINPTGSIYLDGTGDYLRLPGSIDYEFGAGDFTIEMWIQFLSLIDGQCILTYGWPAGYAPFLFYVDTVNNRVSFYSSSDGGSWNIAIQTPIINNPQLNTWYHIAVSRSGNAIRTFSNGTLVSTVTSGSSLYVPPSDTTLTIGAGNTGSNNINSYINNLNIYKGSALYIGNFTPPTRS